MIELLFGREYHPALKFLGSKDWLKLVRDEENRFVVEINPIDITVDDVRRYTKEDLAMAKFLVSNYSVNVSAMFLTLTAGKSIYEGPKVFRPTLEQCLALENTDANIAFDFYQQPYNVVILEMPHDYVRHLKEVHNINTAPKYVMAYRHDNGCIAATAVFGPDNVIVNCMSPKYDTVEEAIVKNRYEGWDEDFKVAELVQRLAINFSLMMTLLGVRVAGPLSPDTYNSQKRKLKSKNPREVEKAKKSLISTPYLVEFVQNIKFYDEIKDEPMPQGTGEVGGTHRSPKPHWRRGHFRQQPYGPERSLRKLTYIKPIMVMSKRFAGDLSDTSVVYDGKAGG